MFKYALDILLRRKLRTVLTSMGITISVVLLSFIIFGMQDLEELLVGEFTQRFSPTEVAVSAQGLPFAITTTEDATEETKEPSKMTEAFVEDLLEREEVIGALPLTILTGMKFELKDQDGVFDQAFVAGADFNGDNKFFVEFEGENEREKGEAFIANYVVEAFGLENDEIMGETVIVSSSQGSFLSTKSKNVIGKSYEYTIVGVFDPGQDRNDLVLKTEDSLEILVANGGFDDQEDYLNNVGYDQLIFTIDNEDNVLGFKEFVEDEHGLTAFTSEDILGFLGTITQGLTMALVMFGLVSSIVASIGIINTMVMSIYEQTREIGIIKAIGASNGQVLSIFLIQSGFIGLFGGLVGLAIVYLTMLGTDGFIVAALAEAGFTATEFFTFRPQLALIIAGLSILVGVLAGIYPAMRAARLDPVKALRYE